MDEAATENPQCGAAPPITLQPMWLLTLAGPGRSGTGVSWSIQLQQSMHPFIGKGLKSTLGLSERGQSCFEQSGEERR